LDGSHGRAVDGGGKKKSGLGAGKEAILSLESAKAATIPTIVTILTIYHK
jgi:hypothetical protein